MDRAKLKNVVILILLLTNLCLLASLAQRLAQEHSARERMAAELTELLSSEGVRLTAEVPAGLPPPSKVLTRDVAADRHVASSLLGEGMVETDEGGGILAFSSALGSGQFRAGGRFEIAGRLTKTDPVAVCRTFCHAFGYGDLSLEPSGGGQRGSAIQYFDGYPVVNAAIEFLIEDDCLISVSGVHLPSGGSGAGPASTGMTAATALSKFLEARRSGGAVVSEVTDLYLCYEAQNSPAAPISLTAAWCVVTDAGKYYVNCATGAVSED